MEKQITKTHKNILNKQKGFTLVELIIVITILAILATIAFISFKSYSWNARDGNRVTALSNIQKWLDIYQVKVWKYPHPDDVYGTGTFWGESLNYVWYISGSLSKVINMNKTPIDPKTQNNYVYWVSSNYQKYQLATTLEELEAWIVIPTTYAAQWKAKVVWNYTYPLRLGPKIYSLPSLIFVWSGDLLTNSTWFIVNNSWNLPYSLDGQLSNNVSVTEQLQQITGTGNLTLTWVDISNIKIDDLNDETKIKDILDNLWIKKDELGSILFPTTGNNNSNSSTTPPAPVVQHTVTFNTNGWSAISSQTVSDNNTITSPATPTKVADTFLWWYTDAWTTTEYNFSSPITEDITLYAKWAWYQALSNWYYLVDSNNTILPNGCSQNVNTTYVKEKCILKIWDMYVAPSNSDTTASHWNSAGAWCTSTTTTCTDLIWTTNGNAAAYCTNLKNTISPPVGTDWFLPPRDMWGLQTIQQNISKINHTWWSDWYWSSTTDYLWSGTPRWRVVQLQVSNMYGGTDFDADRRVRCIAK